ETNPVEAGLSWLVDQSYLATEAPRKAFFPGSEAILTALKNGPERVRVGVRPEGRMPVREGALVKNSQGETVGRITSGGFGPTFGGPVAMGYVQARYGLPATVLTVEVRGREIPAHTRPLPFVPHRYFR
ncbi:MAG: glycine cleavage T C-terminal barrel domain-containing protein, partial [Gammaproteobacteria bacterium]